MSQALELAAIPEYIPIPKGTSHRQFKLAKLILSPGSDEKTRTELMKEAGFSDISALANSTRTINSDGTQRAIEAISKARLDSARSLESKSASKIAARIEDDSASDALLVATYKTATELRLSGADEQVGITEAELATTRAYLNRLVHLATEALIRKYSLHNIDAATALSAEDVAAIAVAAQAP